VVDTGVDLDTPDLAGRIAPGYNAWTGGRTPPQDDNGHGTMVAGIAAAITATTWESRVPPGPRGSFP
jgi:thermitase